jgi:hypothetical protein
MKQSVTLAKRGGPLVRPAFKAPRAAAIAGILFPVVLIVSLWLLWVAIPDDPLEVGAWLQTSSARVSPARSSIPVAGGALLGYASAVDLLFANSYFNRAFFVFPFWRLFAGIYVLIDKSRA